MPEVPTVAESGVPGYEMVPWISVVAPRGLPPEVGRKLAKALADSLADPGLRAELAKTGLDVAYQPGAVYDERVAKELPLLRAYMHKAGIQAE
jgi:tripartite-type tricarboxylate transporter receptor subunit TctC